MPVAILGLRQERFADNEGDVDMLKVAEQSGKDLLLHLSVVVTVLCGPIHIP
jgi:hypothetical protein